MAGRGSPGQGARGKFAAPAVPIGYAGQVEEWLEDWDIDVSEMDHRHLSHLHAVWRSIRSKRLNSPQHQSDPSTSVKTMRLAEVSIGVYACGLVWAVRSVLGSCS
ncbi:glycosyl hydrolase family 95 catalytic domain-containing protein [Rhizobium laguerreae]|uniref:glycosyl hydrolase family 95 catalytic domain-containing protein n=1 Tax=Rhizobium laguerreae TaxID=1076926 RepID=UPI0035E3F84F